MKLALEARGSYRPAMRAVLVILSLALGGTAALAQSARTGMKMTVDCQQSLSDGRTLIEGTMLPHDLRYRILSYEPRRAEDGWSYGRCVIQVLKGASG